MKNDFLKECGYCNANGALPSFSSSSSFQPSSSQLQFGQSQGVAPLSFTPSINTQPNSSTSTKSNPLSLADFGSSSINQDTTSQSNFKLGNQLTNSVAAAKATAVDSPKPTSLLDNKKLLFIGGGVLLVVIIIAVVANKK